MANPINITSAPPRARGRRSLLVAISAIALAMALGLGVLAVGEASADSRAGRPKPTIVLVHGAWADSSGWDAQVETLQRQGYPVVAPANPLRGLDVDSAYLRSVLTTIDGPIVLVGHSYGGAVITNAARGVPNVKALVYIAGFAPAAGESTAQLVARDPGSEIGPDTLIFRPYPLPGGGQGTDLYVDQDGFRNAFASDLPRRTADRMQAEQRPFSQEAFESVSGEPAWETIPSWYLVSARDKTIPPVTQRFMAERAQATVEEVDASHVSMISEPGVVDRMILRAVDAIR